jgi:acyl dehydratase
MITYADFEPGRVMGSSDFTLGAAALDAWCRLFPADDLGGAMPHGMAAVIAMRAYVEVVQPRPPGNVHAAQRFEVVRLPRLGETLTTAVACVAKEIRRDRRRVTFGTETAGSDGRLAISGRMTVLWAR